jgi:hypothetical protein
VADSYSQTLEKVTTLLELCKRAKTFLRENMGDLSDGASASYVADWRVLEAIFEGIEANRDVPRSVMLGRAQWYDQSDEDTVEMRLNDFSLAYKGASKSVDARDARDTQRELESMIGPLEDVEVLLRDTIYKKVLNTLQNM